MTRSTKIGTEGKSQYEFAGQSHTITKTVPHFQIFSNQVSQQVSQKDSRKNSETTIVTPNNNKNESDATPGVSFTKKLNFIEQRKHSIATQALAQ
jgi:hypothetical protein